MPSWVQCSVTGKMIPKEEYSRYLDKSAAVHEDVKPFRSPIDGTLISSRAALRSHNKKHGVTDPRDYGDQWFSRKQKERDLALTSSSKEQRRDRVEQIQKAIYEHTGG